MATNEGIEEDLLSCGDYSQFLGSAGDIMGSNGGGGSSTGNHLDEQSFMYSSFHSSKSSTMLCFGNNVNKEEKGFLERSTKAKTTVTTNHNPISGVTGNSDSSSASSSNNSSSSNGFNTKSKRGQKVGETPKKREEERKNGLGTSEEPNSVPLSKNKRTSKKSKKETPTSTTRPVKVRKEKLGERITALQQLVSPFGKTDTASVLHEAMGYIRFLHDQVQVLCSPYLQKLPSSAHLLEGEYGGRRGLRSRGLCLVPIEYTAYVANSNGADLWSPAAMGSNSSSSKH